MLRLYSGEYLVSPVPLHFSMNWCSHNCFYCFANLNNKKRRTEINDIKRLVAWQNYNTIESEMIGKGYPVLISNTTDPLAKTNEDTFINTWRASRMAGVKFCYQTKGGSRGIEDEIINDDPTMFYISITSDNDDKLKAIEPGAPGFRHRIDLIERARAKGHHVVVGLNPLIAEWWDDIEALPEVLKSAGVTHIWKGRLHLSHLQTAQMSEGIKESHKEIIKRAMSKTIQPDFFNGEDFNVFDYKVGSKGNFWQPYFDLGYPFMPTLDGFISHLREKGESVVFDFAYFDKWAGIGIEKRGGLFSQYLNSFGRSIRNNKEDGKARCFTEVHEWLWRILDYPTTLRHDYFSIGVEYDGDEVVVITDGKDRPLLVYNEQNKEITFPISECKISL